MGTKSKEASASILRGLLDYRRAQTVHSIYERIAPGEDGRIRSAMNPAGTETGRFSHAETFLEASTNLGNLPKKVAVYDPLYDVRFCLIPDHGRVLGEADLSQAEARVAAWEAADPLAMQQYSLGVDRYRFFAAHLYGVRSEDVTKVQRHIAKTVVLALQYGVSWKKLQNTVNKDSDLTGGSLSAQLAKKAVALYHELYPFYAVWWDRVFDEVRTRGYLVNPFGRRRDFFARTDSEESLAALKREAVAFVPQSCIADLLNLGLAELYEKHDPRDLRILLQVHDAIIFDCDPKDVLRVGRLMKQTLEKELEIGGQPLVVPAEVSFSSKSWAKMKKVL